MYLPHAKNGCDSCACGRNYNCTSGTMACLRLVQFLQQNHNEQQHVHRRIRLGSQSINQAEGPQRRFQIYSGSTSRLDTSAMARHCEELYVNYNGQWDYLHIFNGTTLQKVSCHLQWVMAQLPPDGCIHLQASQTALLQLQQLLCSCRNINQNASGSDYRTS